MVRDKIIEKLLEMCKYIEWQNVESFDELEKGKTDE